MSRDGRCLALAEIIWSAGLIVSAPGGGGGMREASSELSLEAEAESEWPLDSVEWI